MIPDRMATTGQHEARWVQLPEGYFALPVLDLHLDDPTPLGHATFRRLVPKVSAAGRRYGRDTFRVGVTYVEPDMEDRLSAALDDELQLVYLGDGRARLWGQIRALLEDPDGYRQAYGRAAGTVWDLPPNAHRRGVEAAWDRAGVLEGSSMITEPVQQQALRDAVAHVRAASPHPLRVRVTGDRYRPVVPPDAVFVGRPGPHLPGSIYADCHTTSRKGCRRCDRRVHTHDDVVRLYVEYFLTTYLHEHADADLRGRRLACWCSLDQPCHSEVLLAWLDMTNPTSS